MLDKLPALEAIRKRLTQAQQRQLAGLFRAAITRRQAVRPQVAAAQEPAVSRHAEVADNPASAQIIVDPNQINPKGTTAIDFYVPSLDGKLVAVSLSEGGTEEGNVHVFEVATGKELADVIPRVNGGTAGGSVAWNADGTGFYYTRYPRGNERPKADIDFYQQVYFHKLGTPTEKDAYAIGKDFPRIAEIKLEPIPRDATSWPSWRTATAASSPTTCSARPASGRSSPAMTTRSSAGFGRDDASTCFLARMRRAARSSGCR